MTGPDHEAAADPSGTEDVRRSLRDLIPDYRGPADPLLRVGASIRRRRIRRRALLAVGATAGAAALVAVTPALLLPSGGGRGPASAVLAPPPGPTGPAPAPSAAGVPAPPEPTVYRVARGVLAGARWEVGSTSPGRGARRCLYSDDDLFVRDTVCFDAWKPGGPVSWAAQVVTPVGRPRVTRVVGVAPTPAVRVRVRLGDGSRLETGAVRTPTDPAARFFALVVRDGVVVADVTLLDAAGRPLGPPATDPGVPPCRPGPDSACAEPVK